MPDEMFDSAVVLRELRFPGPPGAGEVKRLYTEYLVPPEIWHEVVVELIRNEGRASWDVLRSVRERLHLSELDFGVRLMLVVWAFLARPQLAVVPSAGKPASRITARPGRTTKAKPGRKMNLGVDLEVLSAGPKTGDIAEKLYCVVAAHRQKSERAPKVIKRLLTENPGLRAFCACVNPALQQAGFKTVSANQYSRIVQCFQAGKPDRTGRTAGRSKAGETAGSPKPQRRKKATNEIGATGLALRTEEKIGCLARSEGQSGETPEATLKRILAAHPGPRSFCPFTRPTLERGGLRGFSPSEYQAVRRHYLSVVPEPPARKSGGSARVGGNYRQKAQAVARHNGWETTDVAVQSMMVKLRKASSNNATTFLRLLNDQADDASVERFSPEEADDLFRLGEAREPVAV